ncbi:MAG: hypothetical protein ABIN80_18665 [Dyadobacter sp.]|uniref:hypothetical protein n=1 Tax=Dyadobacter sp. TaxID=1914288 RepID=UPI0032651F47
MSDKYAVNDAFVRIYNSLIESKTIKNKGELAAILNVKPSTLSEIIAKRQGVTVEFIQKFCLTFPSITPNDFFNVKSSLGADSNVEIVNLQAQIIKLQQELLALKHKGTE